MKVKVAGTGLAYDSVDEAIADVDRMQELRDVEVSDLREAGDEAGAERAADRWNRQIQKTRDAIRGAQEREASATSQPRNRPKKPRQSSPSGSGGGGGGTARPKRRRQLARKAWATRSPGRPSLSLGSGTSGRLLRESGAATATSSATKLVFQLFGLLVGLALVLVVLESETTNRSAVRGIVDFVISAVGAIVDPVDPFTRAAWKPASTPAPSSSVPPALWPGSPRRPARPTVIR